MPVIGQGNYGCVFKPHLKCKGHKTIKNGVGKIFSDEDEFKSEVSKNKILEKLDPNHEFSIQTLDLCTIDYFRTVDKVDDCDILNKQRGEYSQLIYKYGGKNLKSYMEKKGSVTGFIKLLKLFRPILIGIQRMVKHHYVHQDIKPHNILYDGKQLYLIDYGILKENKNIFIKSNTYILEYDYPYYPPEYKIWLYHSSNGVDSIYNKIYKNFRFTFYIGGRRLDLLNFIEDKFTLNLKESVSSVVYNKIKVDVPEKMDLYSLGIVLSELYFWSGWHEKKYTKKSVNSVLQLKVIKLIKGLLHFDVSKRFTIDEALNYYDSIF